jgi:hypothetical protein
VSRLRLLVVLPPLLASLTGCGADRLPAEDVATAAEDVLEDQVGVRPAITCPEDVVAEVGATARCVFTAGDDPTEYGVEITVTSVDGEQATFDVALDEQPTG